MAGIGCINCEDALICPDAFTDISVHCGAYDAGKKSDNVNHPKHYETHIKGLEAIDIIYAALGPERFVTEDGGIYNLGKFELETSKDGAVEFEELRCWGLKRYLEIHDGKYRKSAFAGMNDSLQSQLMSWDTDGTEYTWKQNVQHQDEWGKVIQIGKKHARAEDIWYHEPVPAPRIGNRIPLLKLMLERMKDGDR